MGSSASTIQGTSYNKLQVTQEIQAGGPYECSSREVQTDPWAPDPEVVQIMAQQKVDFEKAIKQVNDQAANNDRTADPEEVWLKVDETRESNPCSIADLIVKRSGWKTVRVFVSSTFKDFHHEREVLVKEVFPDLRNWCEQRRLHLVECDLRWGVPKDSTTELTLKTCLGEIDRCYQDNIMPFFLNMTSERIGWIPLANEVPYSIVQEYRWVFGLSVTEMEIVHGAYRKDNPNSFFLFRNDSFLQKIPADVRQEFIDENPLAPTKMKMLRKMIESRFPTERILHYDVDYEGKDPRTGKIKFRLDDSFSKTVFEFFKARIEAQYPLYDGEEDPLEKAREAHEAFMKSRCDAVIGRDDLLKEIREYVSGDYGDVPLLVLGQPGTGKSSLMAKAADDTIGCALHGQIRGADKWTVFHHFVGAVPGSTDLLTMLCRLLIDIGAADHGSLPTDIDAAVSMSLSALTNPSTKPVIVFIDALNQMDEESASLLCNWVPRKLVPNVRCIFSMINKTVQHENLMSRESKPRELYIKPLNLQVRKDLVVDYLGKFNKKLDMDQIFSLLSKEASENPLWLAIACEELRVYGHFRQISDKINSLPDGLLELLDSVLTRFEQEGSGRLLVGTLCLIEVSSFGLLESELLSILADEDNLMPPDKKAEKGSKESGEKEKAPSFKEKLPAAKWAGVYRALRQFLRPFGDSGEGRLDFYHRSLSKVVRRKYLIEKSSAPQQPNYREPTMMVDGSEEKDLTPVYRWWHKKLADYFQASENYDRKCEEYPYHLVKLKDAKRLEDFLSQWPAIDRYFEEDYSSKLFKYWDKCGGRDQMQIVYAEKLQQLKEQEGIGKEELCSRYTQMGKLLSQAGLYDASMALGQEAMTLAKELGEQPETMVSIHTLMATVWDNKVKLHEFCSRAQIPEERECLKYQGEAIVLLEQLKDTSRKYKVFLGKMLVKTGFTLASFADCGGDEHMSTKDALSKGSAALQRAVELLKEVRENGLLAEAYMTQAVLTRYDKNGQLKKYKLAEELCRQCYGDYHPLMGRINMNSAIAFEDSGDYKTAYKYFMRNYEIAKEVYGETHIKAQRSKNILQEPMYKRIAQQMEAQEAQNAQNVQNAQNAQT